MICVNGDDHDHINNTVSDQAIRPVVVMSLPRARTPRGAASPAPSHKSYGASTRVSGSPGPGSEVRQDSFWDKVGTLGRKKKAAEVQQVEVEGKHAIDSPGRYALLLTCFQYKCIIKQKHIKVKTRKTSRFLISGFITPQLSPPLCCTSA